MQTVYRSRRHSACLCHELHQGEPLHWGSLHISHCIITSTGPCHPPITCPGLPPSPCLHKGQNDLQGSWCSRTRPLPPPAHTPGRGCWSSRTLHSCQDPHHQHSALPAALPQDQHPSLGPGFYQLHEAPGLPITHCNPQAALFILLNISLPVC